MIVDAEKFKASIAQPKGNDLELCSDTLHNNVEINQLIKTLLDNTDDEFFHLTCHVDQAIRQKIELGQFMDLDQLLPKSRMQIMNDKQRMQFVNRDGATYWVPADRENKITGIRRWDQAFRVYAAIYCKANPGRAGEIWQYIYVINSAAASYNWENVAYYDFTFRQLMSEKPNRNWGKIYNQLWNLAMCEPLSKVHHQRASGTNAYNSNSFNVNDGSGCKGDWRDRCCWRFNHGSKCRKWNCNFDHRCNYCGSWNHSANDCPKRKAANSSTQSGCDESSSHHKKWKKTHKITSPPP